FTAGFPLTGLETGLNSSGLLMAFMMVMEGWWLSFQVSILEKYGYTMFAGGQRDEVVVWNDRLPSIYTQDSPFSGSRIFTPKRRLCNQTFYGSFVSKPDWTDFNP
ncbi:hypothetical protein DRO38_01210, partial [Candidatus Bathyarchaeota archaeon]